MKYFIALSNQNKGKLVDTINTVKEVLTEKGDAYTVFVERQQTGMTKPQVMKEALKDIMNSDALLVEASTKEVGVGIEMGFAHALNKPIVLVRKVGSESSNTMEGIINGAPIEYEGKEDLKKNLGKSLIEVEKAWLKQKEEEPDPQTKLIFEEAWLAAHKHLEDYKKLHSQPLSSTEELCLAYTFANESIMESSFQQEDLTHLVSRREPDSVRYGDVETKLRSIWDAQAKFEGRKRHYYNECKLTPRRVEQLEQQAVEYVWVERKRLGKENIYQPTSIESR